MYQLYLKDRFDQLNLHTGGGDQIDLIEYAMYGGAPIVSGRASDSMAMPLEYGDVSETIRLSVEGANQAAIQGKVRRLERFLDRANQNPRRRKNDAVYLCNRFDQDTADWRTEIVAGELTVENPFDDLWRKRTVVTLNITRRHFWEYAAADPMEIPISAQGQSAGTGGKTITFNGTNSWIGIASSAIPGSRPSPLTLEITNTSGGTQYLHTLWIVNDAHTGPTTKTRYAASEMTSTGSNRWLINAASMNNIAGRYCRMFLHHTAGGVVGRVKGQIMVGAPGGVLMTAWQGRDVETMVVTDLGAFPIPPGGEFGGWQLVYFDAQTPWGVSYLQLLPVSSERRIAVATTNFSDNVGIADGVGIAEDGVTGETYLKSGTNKYASLVAHGDPVYVWPGLNQRIHIVWEGLGAGGHSATVRAYTRPRRGTL